MINKSYFFLNLGCPKNQTDGDFVRAALNDLGLAESDYPAEVDFIFVNTCAFIDEARRETEGEIEQLLEVRRNGAKIIAFGCYPALPGFDNDRLPVDASFRFDEVAELLQYIGGDKSYCYEPERTKRVISELPYAYLVISDGCDNRCSYCTIPNIRGRYASRKPDKILAEAEYLALSGAKEIIIVAQDTTVYGRDLGMDVDLPGLCDQIAQVDGIEWIRVMYAHPAHTDEALLDRLYAIPKVCRYLDMPIQHISDNVLKMMRRGYNAGKVHALINHLRSLDKNISLRTTLMTGFPGESDDDFKALVDFVEQAQFDHLGVFVYSPEYRTSAYDFPGRIDRTLAEDRYELLYEIAGDIILDKASARIGRVEPMLIEGVSSEFEGYCEGRSCFQAPEIDGYYTLEITNGVGLGDIVQARIIGENEAEIVSKGLVR